MSLRNFVIELAGLTYRLRTIVNIKSNERTSERASNLKKHVLKNRFISNYFMKAASSSDVKFRAKFEVALQKELLSVVANHSNSDFFTVN